MCGPSRMGGYEMRSLHLGLWCALSIVSLSACSGGTDSATPAESNSPATASQPTAPVAISGRILFTRAGGEFLDETIFMAEADGTGERKLTDPGYACCPRLSPDGSRVLLMTVDQPQGQPLTGATLVLGRADVERLTLKDPTLNLVPQAWSPDGMRIAFEGWDDADPSRTGVYTARFPDGGDLVRLTSTVGGHDMPGDWSPDGTQLVFYRAKPEPDWDIGGSLWLVNADGTNGRRIETPGVAPSWWARWSPDGTKILFATGRTQADGAIWTVDADGTRLTRIFQDADGRFPITPSWSPDGRLIMFGLDPSSDEFQHPANGIYVINADGTGLTLVIGGSDFKRRIEWSR